MKTSHLTLQKITANGAALRIHDVKRVLILYELKLNFIGDSCLRFNKMGYFSAFFNGALVSINFLRSQQNKFYYETLLKNNPHLHHIDDLEWEDIPFETYDVVICLTAREPQLLAFLHEKYGEQITGGQLPLVVFSFSKIMMKKTDGEDVFPVNPSLVDYFGKDDPAGELYISEEERAWGNQWLEAKGIKENEQLYIFLDSTSAHAKLLPLNVYFDILTLLLRKDNVKVLIFDEKAMGKEEFYGAWLEDVYSNKLIFSKQLQLREDLCIISSKYTKLMFGPCTGLMHCASNIFNHFLKNGMRREDVPLLITYTGKYEDNGGNASLWWGAAPLVNCLLLKNIDNRKELVLLRHLSQEAVLLDDQLPCSEYTADLLVKFIQSKLKPAVITI